MLKQLSSPSESALWQRRFIQQGLVALAAAAIGASHTKRSTHTRNTVPDRCSLTQTLRLPHVPPVPNRLACFDLIALAARA